MTAGVAERQVVGRWSGGVTAWIQQCDFTGLINLLVRNMQYLRRAYNAYYEHMDAWVLGFCITDVSTGSLLRNPGSMKVKHARINNTTNWE